jgi:lipopolysaccharide/colanic/teichoic acid biosynthesis glycosyltransferase
MTASMSEQFAGSKRWSKPSAATYWVGRDESIAPESAFLEILRSEIRRTERSGRPFVLVLVRSDLYSGDRGWPIVTTLAAAVRACIRETDWMGWYEYDKVLGIALTEIGEASDEKIRLLVQKLSSAMRQAVGPEEFAALKLVARLFPDGSGSYEDDGSGEGTYRELHSKQNPPSAGMFIKRAIDIAGSLLAMIFFSPLFLVLAILVKLSSPGPVLYCQKRVGQYGRAFDFYKLRSMYTNNDSRLHKEYVGQLIEGSQNVRQANGMYKIANDPRVTRIGCLLRKYSLDELPQFFNVLRGEMSLVGPRPPLPYEFERYRTWHRRRVFDVKPGLTGLWQVKGRSRTTFDEMVRLDLQYMKTRSLWLDMKVILQTPGAMLAGRGAS